MKCLSPVLIRNKYTSEFMYVPCGKCDGCLTSDSVSRSSRLSTDINNTDSTLFVTLTYDNEHIPFIVNGYSGIYRFSSDKISAQLIESTDEIFNISEFVPIRGFEHLLGGSFNPCISVLYYRDFQLFFKRLRKRLFNIYGKDSRFKFFICGEYGTVFQRCHAHILLQFQSRRIAKTASELISECWQMCDWSRLTDTIKFASCGISSYVSSYVNSNFSGCEVSRIKRFRPFKKRSKNLTFGFENDLFQKIKIIVCKGYGKKFPEFTQSDFEYLYDKSISCVSTRLIPKSYFNPYFYRPKGFHNLSFKSFRLLCYSLYGYVDGSKGRRLNTAYYKRFGLDFLLDSADKCFLIRYNNFLNDFAYEDSFVTFDNYITLMYRLFVFYDCLVIKKSMEMYERLSPEDYVRYCYNTFSPDISESRRRNILRSVGVSPDYIDGDFYIQSEMNDIRDSVNKYRNFLLPKHLNSLVNKL